VIDTGANLDTDSGEFFVSFRQQCVTRFS
jgi:hypothetical protein